MAKFTVRCYYTYSTEVEVEANTLEEAMEMGQDICADRPITELEYVGYTNTEVQDETGEIIEFM